MAVIEHAKYYENPMYNVCHAHTSCEIMHIVTGRLTIMVNWKALAAVTITKVITGTL